MSHIFISYRSTEKDFALKLADSLLKSGVNIWLDRLSGIKVGDDWRQSIQNAINSCAAMITIISPSYVKSKYCNLELSRADALNKPIFPILLQDITETDKPISLQNLQYIDFREQRDEVYKNSLVELVRTLRDKGFLSTQTENMPISPDELVPPPPVKELEDNIDQLSTRVDNIPVQRTSIQLRLGTLRKQLEIDRKDYTDVSENFFTLADPEIKNAFDRKMERILKDIDEVETELDTLERG